MNYLQQYQQHLNLKPDGIIGPITKRAMKKDLGIDTDERLAHFLGQCAHESFNFTMGRENMNYSEKRLKEVFKKYFIPGEFQFYAGDPQKIANRVYASRMGNGDELTGDGWKYRGVGAIQLTGKNNIEAYMQYSNITDIEKILDPKHYFRSAKWFFDKNNIWAHCGIVDLRSIMNVSKIINLGSIESRFTPSGLAGRLEETKRFYA